MDAFQPANNTMEPEETTVPSSIKEDDFAIPIKIHLPSTSNTTPIRAAVFFIHGGIFSFGDCHSHPIIAHALANMGLAVVTASFRNGEEAPHRTNITMRDLRDVVDFVRGRWKDVPFGLVGSSSVSYLVVILDAECSKLLISLLLFLYFSSLDYKNITTKLTGRILCTRSITNSRSLHNIILHPNMSSCTSLKTSYLPSFVHLRQCPIGRLQTFP